MLKVATTFDVRRFSLEFQQNAHLSFSTIQPKRWRFSAQDYHTLAESGIIPHEQAPRTELIEGEIFAMTAMGSRHFWAVGQINALLFQHLAPLILAKEIFIAVQSPIALSAYSEPEPDITILRHSPQHDKSALPTASDVVLVIEVADTTLEYDRTKKALLYAQAEIPEYWVVNLVDSVVEVFRHPQHGKYTETQPFQVGDIVPMLMIPSLALSVGEIIP